MKSNNFQLKRLFNLLDINTIKKNKKILAWTQSHTPFENPKAYHSARKVQIKVDKL